MKKYLNVWILCWCKAVFMAALKSHQLIPPIMKTSWFCPFIEKIYVWYIYHVITYIKTQSLGEKHLMPDKPHVV